MNIQHHPDDWITITEAAGRLGVIRNDMHLIPVQRHPVWTADAYRKGDIEKWEQEQLALPDGLLHRLRERKAKADLRRQKRNNPRTQKGQVKKRFQKGALKFCPQCGGEIILHSGHDDLELFEDDDKVGIPEQPASGGKRVIRVEHKGRRRRGECYSVTLDLDAEKAKTSLLEQSKEGPIRRPQVMVNPVPYCSSCGIVVDDDFLALFDECATEADSSALDDDVRAMTSTTFSIETGETADIPVGGESSND